MMKIRSLLAYVLILTCFTTEIHSVTMLTKNDPYPIYTTAYPYSYLLTRIKNYLKGLTDCCEAEWFNLSISPFYQKANKGKNFDGETVFLGDLEGRWNMVGLLYGPRPPNIDLIGTVLGNDKLALFSDVLMGNPNNTVPEAFVLTDTAEVVGWLSVPLRYRKGGLRLEASFQPIRDFGITVQAGFADIKQTITHFIAIQDTPEGLNSDGTTYLGPFTEEQYNIIASLLVSDSGIEAVLTNTPICLEICDFEQCTGLEDLRIFAWWRHVFQINCYPPECETCCDYPQFLLIPFIQAEGTVPIAKKQNRKKAFALPLGNDGHGSLGFTAGLHIDFYETVEIGFYGGMTYFFPRNINNFHVPNHPSQSGVFPFSTTVRRQPGMNGNFGILFHAYHFIDCLSFHAEYAFIHHCEDKLKAIDDPGKLIFRTRQLECLSKWTSQVLNTCFNYDISPNLALGFGVQWPVRQRNSYRSTTLIGTFQATF